MTTTTADQFLKNAFTVSGIIAFAISSPAYGNAPKYCFVAPKTQMRTITPVSDASTPEVDGMYLSAKARALIGAHGAERFSRFKKLRAGWDAGRGLPLDVTAVQTMERFVEALPFEPEHVALFMSAKGHPILNWLDRDGGAIELEFSEDSINYYNETGDIEDDFPTANIGQLMASLPAV